ncbi:hypothetical protein PTKU15_79370 [Paraburkholderia terrae]|nr:hypothetical protein PTKU15_79370 [Paraburkholderia terrae]
MRPLVNRQTDIAAGLDNRDRAQTFPSLSYTETLVQFAGNARQRCSDLRSAARTMITLEQWFERTGNERAQDVWGTP